MRVSSYLLPAALGVQYLSAPSYSSDPTPILRVDLFTRKLYFELPWTHRDTRPQSGKWGAYISRYVFTAHWGYNTWNFYLPTNPIR